jgi:hypothetical protein
VDLVAVDAAIPDTPQPELEAARLQESFERVGPRHLQSPLDTGDGGLRHAGSARQLSL